MTLKLRYFVYLLLSRELAATIRASTRSRMIPLSPPDCFHACCRGRRPSEGRETSRSVKGQRHRIRDPAQTSIGVHLRQHGFRGVRLGEAQRVFDSYNPGLLWRRQAVHVLRDPLSSKTSQEIPLTVNRGL